MDNRHKEDQQVWLRKDLVDHFRMEAKKNRRTIKATIEFAIESAIRSENKEANT